MRLKSYFAGTVATAMAQARGELGPEAMLVQSKRTTSEARHLGQYEVVFALQDDIPPEPAPIAAPAFSDVFAPSRETSIQRLSIELDELKKRIEGMAGAVSSVPRTASNPPDRNAGFRQALTEVDVLPEVAEAVIRKAAEFDTDPLTNAVQSLVRTDPTLGVANSTRRIVALVGPPGAGKTTALVKLATRYGLTARRSMMLLSTDVYRVGAAEQLRLYASILGVGFQTVETPLALAQALEEQRHRELVLIDTPGWARRAAPEIVELGNYLSNDPDIDVHLVLPASNKASDLSRMIDRYAVFQPAKLLFTRLDETDRLGVLLNECYRTGKPISFLSAGEQIPEDLEPATPARISELMFHQRAPSEAGQPAPAGWEQG
jgi:flagellar biosynthesis protein FlhF